MNLKTQATTYLFSVMVFFTGSVFAVHEDCPTPASYPFNDCSLEGIRPGGFPYFDQGVRIKYKNLGNGDFNLKTKFEKDSGRSAFLINPDNILSVGNTKQRLRASYRDGLLEGTVEIRGTLLGFGIDKKETLMTADLEGDPVLSGDGQLLGFNTTNILCHEAFSELCTSSESVYVAFLGALDPEQKKIKTTGIAVTTVPIPAAVWLFGSGLIGMVVLARRQRTKLG